MRFRRPPSEVRHRLQQTVGRWPVRRSSRTHRAAQLDQYCGPMPSPTRSTSPGRPQRGDRGGTGSYVTSKKAEQIGGHPTTAPRSAVTLHDEVPTSKSACLPAAVPIDIVQVPNRRQRVYRASLASLAAELGAAMRLGSYPAIDWLDGFVAATVPRRRRPGIGSWPRSAPRSAGGAAAAGLRSTQPPTWGVAGSTSTVPVPSPAVSWSGCSPAAISRCGSEPCGGCCTRPPPARMSCWPWMWGIWIWPTGGRGCTARVARSSGCSGRPGRPSSSPACWPAGPADRSSWVTAGQPARSPGWTWTCPAGGRGCRTGEPPNFPGAEDGTNLPLLLARSRHASVRSLERYARPGPEAVARHLAETDPARRRP